jgi:hypothetical protein
LAVEQLEDRVLLAADMGAANEAVVAPQDPAPAAEAGSFSSAPDIPDEMARAAGFSEPQGRASTSSAEARAEIEQEFARHIHDGEGQNGPSDGRVANRAGVEPVEAVAEGRVELHHLELLEGSEGEPREAPGDELAEEDLELKSAEEQSRIEAAPGPEGAAPAGQRSETVAPRVAGNLAAFSEAAIEGDMDCHLGADLSEQIDVRGDHEQQTDPPLESGHDRAIENQDAAAPGDSMQRPSHKTTAPDAAPAGNAEIDRLLQRLPSTSGSHEQAAAEDARAHDACFSIAPQAATLEEAVAAAIVPDAPPTNDR